ncbi:MAG: hypothetical protein JWN68_1948 [Nocardioides sp.]|uniref:hypothetical protein n=1 Tax=Nocardioides sp. TaxID=35761 RepID=UPI00261F9552|nr:hypothetical protein [Nocardioides sp.]MCW2833995.1 hypothetical protein [Nocardioides sp.]
MSGTGDSERTNDETWQAIVDNFGERAKIDGPEPVAPAPARSWPEEEPGPGPASAYDDEPRFVPPIPPPLPRPEPRRAIAWAGVFGAPVLMLVALVLQIDLPSLIDYLLIAWFVGGFAYLVATMSRTGREPWDDGSRI